MWVRDYPQPAERALGQGIAATPHKGQVSAELSEKAPVDCRVPRLPTGRVTGVARHEPSIWGQARPSRTTARTLAGRVWASHDSWRTRPPVPADGGVGHLAGGQSHRIGQRKHGHLAYRQRKLR